MVAKGLVKFSKRHSGWFTFILTSNISIVLKGILFSIDPSPEYRVGTAVSIKTVGTCFFPFSSLEDCFIFAIYISLIIIIANT